MGLPRISWASCIKKLISCDSLMRCDTNMPSGLGIRRGIFFSAGLFSGWDSGCASGAGIDDTSRGASCRAGSSCTGCRGAELSLCVSDSIPAGESCSPQTRRSPVSTQYCMASRVSAGLAPTAAASVSTVISSPAWRSVHSSTLSCTAPARRIWVSTREEGTANTEFHSPRFI